MISISQADSCESCHEYIVDVVFQTWLGLEYSIAKRNADAVLIVHQGKTLKLSNDFYRKSGDSWLSADSLPVPSLKGFDLNALPVNARPALPDDVNNLPVLFGVPSIEFSENSIDCGIDILGSIFFMISRYEEAVTGKRDRHDRFPANESISCKEGFLHRPIVNEYLELLWSLMKRLWPGLKRRERHFRIQPTHDVDVPFDDAFRPPHLMVRRAIRDIVKGGSYSLMRENYSAWRAVRKGNLEIDRYNTFDFIARESEQRSLKSAFYFLPSGSPEQDMNAPIRHPVMQRLINNLAARGHEIGIHGHYNTYLSQEEFSKEVGILRQVIADHGLLQETLGGRQHFLRWRNPETFRIWETAGLDYDSTLGFAERPGFRCGTCYEFPVYDVVARRRLKLVEKPLIAMEVSVAASQYMARGYGSGAYDVFKQVKDACRFYKGDFVLLWHNSHLCTGQQRELYRAVLDS